jgi:hypothetical protein
MRKRWGSASLFFVFAAIQWESPYQSVGVYLEKLSQLSEQVSEERNSQISSDALVQAVSEFQDRISQLGAQQKAWNRPIQFLIHDLTPGSQFKSNPLKLKEIWLKTTWAHPRGMRFEEILDQLDLEEGDLQAPAKPIVPPLNLPIEEVESNINSELSIEPIESSRILAPQEIDQVDSGEIFQLKASTKTKKGWSWTSWVKKPFQYFRNKTRKKKSQEQEDFERQRNVLTLWRENILGVAKLTQNEETWIRDYYEGRKKKYVYVRSDCAEKIQKVRKAMGKYREELVAAKASGKKVEVVNFNIPERFEKAPVTAYIEKRDLHLLQLEMLLYFEIIVREIGLDPLDEAAERLKLGPLEEMLIERDTLKIMKLVKDFLVA